MIYSDCFPQVGTAKPVTLVAILSRVDQWGQMLCQLLKTPFFPLMSCKGAIRDHLKSVSNGITGTDITIENPYAFPGFTSLKFKVAGITEDANCLFAAILHQLGGRFKLEGVTEIHTVDDLRVVVNFYRLHATKEESYIHFDLFAQMRYDAFFNQRTTKNIKSFWKSFMNGTIFGGRESVDAIAKSLDILIILIEKSSVILFGEVTNNVKKTVFLYCEMEYKIEPKCDSIVHIYE